MSPQKIIIGLVVSIFAVVSFGTIAQAHETTAEHAEEHQVEALLEQINELLELVAKLQAQLVAMSSDPDSNIGFTKNFSIGDDDFEVIGLQKMLNRDPRTLVSSSGPGSIGQETSYYGAKTASAVARFQELFAEEILTPVGLVKGSGYFGPSTRAKMNEIVRISVQATADATPGFNEMVEDAKDDLNIGSNDDSASASSEESLDLSVLSGNDGLNAGSGAPGALTISESSLDYEFSEDFSIGRATSYAGSPGESVTIDGVKLTNSTRIHFGDSYTTGTASSDGTSLTFSIPNVEVGPYELTFSDGSGNKAIRIMDFVVTNFNATAPELFSVTPAIGPNGTTITINGKGFTSTNNQVQFGMNTINGVASPDGKKLTLTVDSDLDISQANLNQPNAEWPVFIYVANANGRAEKPIIFVIKNI